MIKNLEKILQFLPLGYLYLIILGILKESLFYNQLGINYLNYSSIMDTLIGPIADLTSSLVVTIAVLTIIILLICLNFILKKYYDKKISQKIVGLKENNLSENEIKKHIRSRIIIFVAIGLLSFFLGIGWGQGDNISNKIKTGKIEYNRLLRFNSGESQEVFLISLNSQYYFYVTKSNKNIKIAPINSIKEIEITKNYKLSSDGK